MKKQNDEKPTSTERAAIRIENSSNIHISNLETHGYDVGISAKNVENMRASQNVLHAPKSDSGLMRQTKTSPRSERNVSYWTIGGVLVSVLVGLWGIYIYVYPSPARSEGPEITQLHSGSGDNIGGDKNVFVEGRIQRNITSEQRTDLISSAQKMGHRTMRIYFKSGDQEAESFSYQIADVLKEAGWTVYGPGQLMVAGKRLLALELKSLVIPNETLDLLSHWFNQNGINSQVVPGSPYMGLSEDQIVVGTFIQ